MFQCSSASRKFLNRKQCAGLQQRGRFQCSSASRKFLNVKGEFEGDCEPPFQCSSASRKFLNKNWTPSSSTTAAVSVLFSEPKIPQWWGKSHLLARMLVGFSALQRAENSSIALLDRRGRAILAFQCSSASRKFLNFDYNPLYRIQSEVSVLFSEPKIPQCAPSP